MIYKSILIINFVVLINLSLFYITEDETRTVTKSYSKLARYPKLPTTPILPGPTTESSLAARLNARRYRQQQSTTADVPETLPPVTIIYANSIPTAKPLVCQN